MRMPLLTTELGQTQSLFHTYSQFANAANVPANPSAEESDTEAKIEDLLEQVRRQPPSCDAPEVACEVDGR